MDEPDFSPYTADHYDSFVALARLFYAHEQIAFDPQRIDHALAEMSAPCPLGFLHMITFREKVAGYLLVTLCYSMEFGGRFLLLDELFIREDFRGHGLGKKAVQFAETLCQRLECQYLRLEVARQNQTALTLYQKAGFVSHDRDYLTKDLKSGKI